MATFPTSIISFGADVVDGVDDVMAAHVNSPRAEIVALETYLLGPRFDDNLLACSLTYDESWQGGTATNDVADDVYAPAVLWNVLNDGGAGAAPDIGGVAGGTADPFVRYFQATLDATAQVGFVQFVGSQRTKAHRGQVVSLSADIWGTGISNVRMAVVVWTGTADSITSDIVSSWGASPTLAANWAYIGTPASIAISTTRARKSVTNLTIPSNANNLGVFIWLPAQEASADVLNFCRVKLEPGATATEFVGRGAGEELRRIERFYEKSFAITTAPADGVANYNVMGAAVTNGILQCDVTFKTRKRGVPTVTLYRGNQGATAATWSQFVGGVWDDPTASAASGITSNGFYTSNTDAAAYTAGNAYLMLGHYVADSRL